MNLENKILLSIAGGIEVTFYVFSPILISVLWLSVSGFNWGSYLIFGTALVSSLFRAIKIGFLKNG